MFDPMIMRTDAQPGKLFLSTIRWAGDVVTDTVRTHATVLSALEGEYRPDRRMLWASPDHRSVIVQADVPVSAGGVRGAAVRSVLIPATFAVDDRVRVSLIANPTKAVPVPGGRGKRTPLPITDSSAWLERQTRPALEWSVIAVEDMGNRNGRKTGMLVTHRMVGFYGIATVTDPCALAALIRSGVGPGKAYGAGLMLVTLA